MGLIDNFKKLESEESNLQHRLNIIKQEKELIKSQMPHTWYIYSKMDNKIVFVGSLDECVNNVTDNRLIRLNEHEIANARRIHTPINVMQKDSRVPHLAIHDINIGFIARATPVDYEWDECQQVLSLLND